MSLEEKEQIIQQLQAELEKARSDHESFKVECKELEDLLEAQNNKKSQEIKKLKSEAMQRMKEGQNIQSKEIQAKDKQIAQLTEQLNKKSEGSNEQVQKNKELSQKIKKLQQSLDSQIDKGKKLEQNIKQLQTSISKLKQSQNQLKTQLQRTQTKLQQTQKTVEQGQSQINNLSTQLQKLNSKVSSTSPNKSKAPEIKKTESSNNNNSAELNALKQEYKKAQKQIQSLKLKLKQSQSNRDSNKKSEIDIDQHRNLQRTCKQLKNKLSQLLQQKNNLQQSFKLNNEYKPTKELVSSKSIRSKPTPFSVFITTKKHYISPFLQFNGKIIRVLKQNRNSFEKCLGSLKFSVENISFDFKELAYNAIQNIIIPQFGNKQLGQKVDIQQGQQIIENAEEQSHKTISIVILGAKHTSKKAIFISAIQMFIEKLKQSQNLSDIEIKFQVYKNKTNQIPAAVNEQFTLTLETLDEMIKKALSFFSSNQNSSPSKRVIIKQKQKPKNQLRFFSIHLGNKLTVEFITSSNISVIKQKDKLNSSLQNIVFHHLPFSSSTERQYECILTINPIVQQYENCRLCLSLVNQPIGQRKQQLEFEPTLSPLKDEFISQSVKKRIQSCEKETQQQSLKVYKMENQIQFYRSRIEVVLLRVKNIISIQGKQTPYLKKSPIVLTLQKLQRSLLSILQRSSNQSKRDNQYQKQQDAEDYENYEENNEEEYHQSSQDELL